MSDWDTYFARMVKVVATKSKDRSTKVGCVIVGPNHEIRTTGYNGMVRGANDDLPERHERPEKYFHFEHSERNAVYNAARCGVPLEGCTAYVSWCPCIDCARALVQCGIVKVRAIDDGVPRPHWEESLQRSRELFAECGVDFAFIPDPDGPKVMTLELKPDADVGELKRRLARPAEVQSLSEAVRIARGGDPPVQRKGFA